ncbi:MAG: hypothetical protein H6965_04555 [Chromatiaceae bacterium]|nr:hypothetical protein [Chromatiaceae bacterium]
MSSPAGPPEADTSPFQVELPAAPYPGLRPFERQEWPVFFGRESMATEVIDRLMTHRFVVVHGNSGCGKSSLIRAGVQAQLEQEQARSGRVWLTAEMHPGNGPLWAMARALASGDPQRAQTLRRLLNRGMEAAQALPSQLGLTAGQRICLLVDQFEELFAFARLDREETRLFADILVGLEQDPPAGLYLVLTMRSEFLGHCSSYPGLAEVVNRTQYLLPQMSRPALERAIQEPARLYGGEVSQSLANALIADSAGGADQLPLIQHGLMLLHFRRVLRDRSGTSTGSWCLDVTDFSEQGGLSSLLSGHADQVMARLLQENPGFSSDVIADLFRALADVNADGHAIRRRQTLAQLVQLTSADTATVTRILDAFRANGVSFLKPYGTLAIAADDLVDISHEALIRCWQRIADPDPVKGWLAHEVADGLVWRALVVQSASFQRDAKNVLSPATTDERAAWLRQRNRYWSARYGGHWEEVNQLIEASQAAAESARHQEKERLLGQERLQAEKAKRRLALAGLLVAAILTGLALWQTVRVQEALKVAELQRQKAEEQREIAEKSASDLQIANTELNSEIERRKAAQAEIAQVQMSAALARDSAAQTLANTLYSKSDAGNEPGNLPDGSPGQPPGVLEWALRELDRAQDPNQVALLAQSLTKLSGELALDVPQSERLLGALLHHLQQTKNVAASLTIAQAIRVVMPLLPPSYRHRMEAAESTALMVKLMQELPSSTGDGSMAVAQILALRAVTQLLAPQVSAQPAIELLAGILEKLPGTEQELGVQQAREAFYALAAQVDAADATVMQQLQPVTRTLALIGELPAARLYIHIAEEQQRPAAIQLQQQLEKLEVNGMPLSVPGIQLITSFKYRSDLRCFRQEECRSDGAFLAATLSGWLVQPEVALSDLSERYQNTDKIRARHYELWIGSGPLLLKSGDTSKRSDFGVVKKK